MFKRIVKGLALLLALVTAAGCSFGSLGNAAYGSIEGYPEAANAKTLYAPLDRGHFYMQDNATGMITEAFTFKYRSDGNMVYSYMGTEDGVVYYEFHNGSEINKRYGHEDSWSFVQQGSDDYFVYTRDDPHPYAGQGVISVNAYAVTDSEVEEYDGGLKITFYYDAAQLADSLAELGALDSFESTLWLNEEGYCYRLDQLAVFDGGESVSDYSMFIDRMNEVEELTRPEI